MGIPVSAQRRITEKGGSEGLRIEQAGNLAVRGIPTRGIEPQRTDCRAVLGSERRGIELGHVTDANLRLMVDGKVVPGHRSGIGIDVVGHHRESLAEKGCRVRSDAAAQVGDRPGVGVPKPSGVPQRDGTARGLFQPGTGEQHALGFLPELGPGLHPEFGLGQHVGGLLRSEASFAEGAREGQCVAFAVFHPVQGGELIGGE